MAELTYTLTKRPDESYMISFTGGPVELNDNNPKLKLSIGPIQGIASIDSYTIDIETETSTNYIKKYFKYKNGDDWSDLLPLESITGDTINTLIVCSELYLDFYFIYVNDGNGIGNTIYINNFFINGEYALSSFDSVAQLNQGEKVILAPKDTYKVFGLNDFQVLSNHNNYNIKFRYTQTNGRTYSEYKPLTTENIKNSKIDPLRFVNFEYFIENNGSALTVYDIILDGDFQNVSANYLKTNRYGLKEDCIKSLTSQLANNSLLTSNISSYGTATAANLTTENNTAAAKSGYFNPYDFQKITDFANMLGNQVSGIAGWTVDYHLTDPDGNGIDKYVHEYTLKNIVDYKQIKVLVPDNKFPNETVILNQFNLDLFDTFEIHIMKDDFKNAFGITRRPSEDDMIYFCMTGNMFIVKHAQAFRSIMNQSTYYKLVLEKYEQRTNIRNLIQDSKTAIDTLTNNTSFDDLFGESMKEESMNVANKQQLKPTTLELYRQRISKKVEIVSDKIIIDNFDVIKNYYNLSDKTIKNKIAIEYKKSDKILGKGDNRSFTFWFNFNNLYKEDSYISQSVIDSYDIINGNDFNLLNNYDDIKKSGYKIYYRGGILYFFINKKQYKMKVDLLTNVWYAGLINVDQSMNTMNFNIYRKNSDIKVLMFNTLNHAMEELSIYNTTGITEKISEGYVKINNTEEIYCNNLELVKTLELDFVSESFDIENNLSVLGSDIKFTNLKVFNDIIPENQKVDFLLEEIVRNEYNLILIDNAHKILETTNYPNKNWK
ncbi:hypothetical protein M0Q50_01000 [bacterium]|jgi:hypothetical protein|nr:hypothetical protein [bacterium]